MWRGIFGAAATACLGWVTPHLCAQYPIYAPPQAYAPVPYGYAAPMMRPPVYAPNPMMMARPMYYPQPIQYPRPMQPALIYPAQATSSPRVYNFGPLDETPAPATVSSPTLALPSQPTSGHKTIEPPKIDGVCEAPSACGPTGCDMLACPSEGCCVPHVPCLLPPPCPHGHCISYIGVNLLVPYPATDTAFTTQTPGSTTATDFTHQLLVGPRAMLGYVFHNGWGFRADYMYLTGASNVSAINTDPTGDTIIATPGTAPFQIVTPGPGLAAGIGADHLSFRRNFEFHVADVEVIKECNLFDMCFVWGLGARYAFVQQGYRATRSNPGGAAGPANVTVDEENLSFRSQFEGFGPTLSFEGVHPIKGSGFAFYGNLRGSAVIGVERFHEDAGSRLRATVGGVPAAVDTFNTRTSTSSRVAPMGEAELGLQCGKRCGRCYFYTRAGVAASRWWNVGSPLGLDGDLDMIGGTVTVGLIY